MPNPRTPRGSRPSGSVPEIRKGDTVVVLAGKDAGKQGKVLSVDSKTRTAKLEGLNLHKKHVKQNPQMKVKGGILAQEAPIPLSRLAPWCRRSSRRSPGRGWH